MAFPSLHPARILLTAGLIFGPPVALNVGVCEAQLPHRLRDARPDLKSFVSETSRTTADRIATPKTPVAMPSLVLQLGDATFARRVQAEQELLGMGVQGLKLLTLGIQSNDPEIRQRSHRLMGILQKAAFLEQAERIKQDPWTAGEELAPAWELYQQIAGDSLAAREIYVNLIEQEPELMMSLVLKPTEWNLDFERRCADLRTFFDRHASREMNPNSALTLIFLSMHPNCKLSPTAAGAINAMVSENFVTAIQKVRGERRRVYMTFLSRWISTSGHASAVSRLMLANRLQLPAGIDPALEVLANHRSVGISRSQLTTAVGFLANFGTIDHVQELEKLLQLELVETLESPSPKETPLDSESPMADSLFASGREPTEAAQARLHLNDIALLAIIKITKQPESDYPFSQARVEAPYRNSNIVATFSSEGDRHSALVRWVEWKRMNPAFASPHPEMAVEGEPG